MTDNLGLEEAREAAEALLQAHAQGTPPVQDRRRTPLFAALGTTGRELLAGRAFQPGLRMGGFLMFSGSEHYSETPDESAEPTGLPIPPHMLMVSDAVIPGSRQRPALFGLTSDRFAVFLRPGFGQPGSSEILASFPVQGRNHPDPAYPAAEVLVQFRTASGGVGTPELPANSSALLVGVRSEQASSSWAASLSLPVAGNPFGRAGAAGNPSGNVASPGWLQSWLAGGAGTSASETTGGPFSGLATSAERVATTSTGSQRVQQTFSSTGKASGSDSEALSKFSASDRGRVGTNTGGQGVQNRSGAPQNANQAGPAYQPARLELSYLRRLYSRPLQGAEPDLNDSEVAEFRDFAVAGDVAGATKLLVRKLVAQSLPPELELRVGASAFVLSPGLGVGRPPVASAGVYSGASHSAGFGSTGAGTRIFATSAFPGQKNLVDGWTVAAQAVWHRGIDPARSYARLQAIWDAALEAGLDGVDPAIRERARGHAELGLAEQAVAQGLLALRQAPDSVLDAQDKEVVNLVLEADHNRRLELSLTHVRPESTLTAVCAVPFSALTQGVARAAGFPQTGSGGVNKGFANGSGVFANHTGGGGSQAGSGPSVSSSSASSSSTFGSSTSTANFSSASSTSRASSGTPPHTGAASNVSQDAFFDAAAANPGFLGLAYSRDLGVLPQLGENCQARLELACDTRGEARAGIRLFEAFGCPGLAVDFGAHVGSHLWLHAPPAGVHRGTGAGAHRSLASRLSRRYPAAVPGVHGYSVRSQDDGSERWVDDAAWLDRSEPGLVPVLGDLWNGKRRLEFGLGVAWNSRD